jgi:hypothetical protein
MTFEQNEADREPPGRMAAFLLPTDSLPIADCQLPSLGRGNGWPNKSAIGNWRLAMN